jgi:prevent-host-death family protein
MNKFSKDLVKSLGEACDQAEGRASSARVHLIEVPDVRAIRRELMSTDVWNVADAKAKFSEVIERAQSRGPQIITRNGRVAAVIVSAQEWERKTRRIGNLAEFFAASPLRGSGLKVRRLKDRPCDIDL